MVSWQGNAEPQANPILQDSYGVYIDGIKLADFDKCEPSGGDWTVIKKVQGLPGEMSIQCYSGAKNPAEIKLTKTISEGHEIDIKDLWNWKEEGSYDRRSGSIVVYDQAGAERMRYNFYDAWVSSCTPPTDLEKAEDPKGVTFEITLQVSKVVME
jgi:phage tail-like protein